MRQKKSDNPFTEYYKTISNTDLIIVIDNPGIYQPEAVEAAKLEFIDRNLSDEQIAEARVPLLERHAEQERQTEKINAIKEKVWNTGSMIADAINPIQKSKPSTDRIILTISIVYGIIVLYTIISKFSIILFYLENFFNSPLENSLVLVPFLVILFGIILFWKRMKIGWILLGMYVTWLSVFNFWEIIEAFNWKPTGIDSLDGLYPGPSPGISIFAFIFCIATILAICKSEIRKIYAITRSNMATTIGASFFLAVFILMLLHY